MFKGFKKNDKYLTIAVYAFLVIAASIGLVCVLINFGAITGWVGDVITAMSSFIYGFIIAYICNAIYKKLHKYVFKFVEKKKPHPKLRKYLSIFCSYVIFIIILTLFVLAVIPSLITSIESLFDNSDHFVGNLVDSVTGVMEGLSNIIPAINPEEIGASIEKFFASDSTDGAFAYVFTFIKDNILSIGTVLVEHIFYIIVGFILSIYFLIYKEKMIAKCKRILCAFLKEDKYKGVIDFARYTDKTFGRYLLGTLVDSALVGVIMFFALWILQLPFPALIAVTCGVTNIIPFFGPFIGAIPSALLIFISTGDFFQVLIFAIVVLVLQQIDGNLIAPHIHGASTGMTPIGVIAAVTFTSHVFGFVGMVIGVPLCAVIFYYCSRFIDKKLKKKNLPTQPEYYRVNDIFDDENFAKARCALEAEEQLENSEALAAAVNKEEILSEIKEQVVEKVLNEALEGINETAKAQAEENS